MLTAIFLVEEKMWKHDWTLMAFRWRIFYLIYIMPFIFIGPFAYLFWAGDGLSGNIKLLYYNLRDGNWNGAMMGAGAIAVFLPVYSIPLWFMTEMVAYWQRRANNATKRAK